MRNTSILRWEELVINAFPAIASELYDSWLLRYSNGYTYRGNCVNPLYAGEGALVEKIIVCEARYAGRNLPCVFKMTPDAPAQLDALLEERGYCDAKHADIMAREITSDCFLKQPDVTVLCEFTDAWMIDFAVLNETTEEPDFSSVKRMLFQIQYIAAMFGKMERWLDVRLVYRSRNISEFLMFVYQNTAADRELRPEFVWKFFGRQPVKVHPLLICKLPSKIRRRSHSTKSLVLPINIHIGIVSKNRFRKEPVSCSISSKPKVAPGAAFSKPYTAPFRLHFS